MWTSFPDQIQFGSPVWGFTQGVSIQFFQRPYRYFSIALKVVLSLSDGYEIFEHLLTLNFLSKIDITMTTMDKKMKSMIAEFSAI